ncbi:hypothetical protein K435DRAFT_805615 [Dendrothele bispora CBS 962.96]|uniref:Uncharacterized protein n=1 Tax=Dendrothele bispora (strain CBS 962.96) TaxID=1314807 RepID=A0A4S8LAH3_DENBC|nr:hypothetical protein K435DRAFT_805615 [Dendrothele bispora CBS 962.96]
MPSFTRTRQAFMELDAKLLYLANLVDCVRDALRTPVVFPNRAGRIQAVLISINEDLRHIADFTTFLRDVLQVAVILIDIVEIIFEQAGWLGFHVGGYNGDGRTALKERREMAMVGLVMRVEIEETVLKERRRHRKILFSSVVVNNHRIWPTNDASLTWTSLDQWRRINVSMSEKKSSAGFAAHLNSCFLSCYMSGCCVLGSGPDFVTSGDLPLTPGQQPSTAGMAEGQSARDSCRPMTSPNDGFIQTDNSRPETPDHPKSDMLTPQTAGVTRSNSNTFSHSDILLTFRLREESRRREIEEYERAIEEIDQEEDRIKEEIRKIEEEMAESDRRHAKRRADRRNQQEVKPGPRETVEPGHGINYPMTVPQPSLGQPIPSGPSIPPVPNSAQYPPVIWPPVPANWAQHPALPPVIWPPIPINWTYPVQPPTSSSFPPPIPFLNLSPPLSPRQADNFSAAPRIPPLPPQIHPPALSESPPKNQKLGKTTARRAPRPEQPNSHGKKYQGGCSARVCERNNPVQGYCGGGNRGESRKRGKDIGTSHIPAEPDGGVLSDNSDSEESDSKEEMNAGTFESLSACAVICNDTSITITIPGIRIDMDSDVEVEADGSENSNSDENSDADENSSEEESSGEEESSDSDEESK